MESAPLGALYYPLVTVFPWLLAGIILTMGKLSAARVAVAVVLVSGGAQALYLTSTVAGGSIIHVDTYRVDGLIGLSLPFIASQFPSPLGGPRGARVAAGAWVAALALWGVVWAWSDAGGLPLGQGVDGVIHDAGFILAGGVMAAHTIPRGLRLAPGPLRAQTLLVAAGIGAPLMGFLVLAGTGGLLNLNSVAGGWRPDLFRAGTIGMYLAAAYYLVAMIGQAASGAARNPRRDALALLGVLAVGVAVGLLDYHFRSLFTAFHWKPSDEFLSQALRPLLLAVAVVQYDLFRIPPRVRRPLLTVTAGLFALSLFAMLTALLSGAGFRAPAIPPLAPVVAFAVVLAGAVVAREPLQELFGGGDAGPSRRAVEQRARLERYRLALEQAKAEGGNLTEQDLAALRMQLGISREQHGALDAVLASNLVIPTAALLGTAGGTVVAGRYEVVRELGRGGQGRVHLALDREAGGEVVLKEVLRPWDPRAPSRRSALEREAGAIRTITSPRLPRVHGIVEEPWQTYLVRDYVSGQDLAQVVEARGPLPPEEALRVAVDVLEGLEALHAAGVLHLDVKPANVVVRPEGGAVLIDHGAARLPSTEAADVSVTRSRDESGDVLTLRWAAPEQLLGEAVDARTDVFQAAGVLVFALTGRAPVEGQARHEVEAAILRGAPRGWDEDAVPEPLRELVDRARAPRRDARPPSAAAMRALLGQETDGQAGEGGGVRPSPRQRVTRGRG